MYVLKIPPYVCCNVAYFPFWFRVQDFGSYCTSSMSLITYFLPRAVIHSNAIPVSIVTLPILAQWAGGLIFSEPTCDEWTFPSLSFE